MKRTRHLQLHQKPPIVVIGGGHAGVEAAHAAARMGADVVLVTLRGSALVRLSCNPAIGGIGKGHLVREIDAMGGLMGIAADLAGIHFRVLNRSRGPAVHGPRIQQDYHRYPEVVAELIEAQPRITILEGEAARVLTEGARVTGLETADGTRVPASAIVVTTGTFLRGKMFQGLESRDGGRFSEPPAVELSRSLSSLGLRLDRFKTGTPPRLAKDSIELDCFERQPGDVEPEPFSFAHRQQTDFEPALPQTITHLAYTNAGTHRLVRDNLARSPLYTGSIRSPGPRYCPSFEDKVVKFPDRDRHLLHLEPMGLRHPWIYVNGLSTSLPASVQNELVGSIDGLEAARIERYGYAVEYDFVVPTQLWPTLESRVVRGLFLAGQICGTTGYEEAAALGLVAGANAARFATENDLWLPDRLSSYLGVMVDDLTTRGVVEPYRMFTSRAEMRLSLSPDTADRRLTPLAEQLQLIDRDQARRSADRWERIEAIRQRLEREGELRASRPTSAADRIRRGEDPETVLLQEGVELSELAPRDRATLISIIRYRGYLERESREAGRLRDAERVQIPSELRLDEVPGLSHEIRERLTEVRPRSLGQASRIPGVTPAAVALLAAAISQHRRAPA